MHSQARHQCLIYEGSPSQKLPVFAAIIQQKLSEGYRCLYLNSAPMVAGLRSALAAIGTDVAAEVEKGSLLLSSEPVSDGVFDSEAMLAKLEESLNQAIKQGYKGLWASGDMSWEFGPQKDFARLMEYELLLNEMFHRRSELQGICQYHKDSLPEDALRQSLLVHPTIVINDTLARVNPHYLESSWPTDLTTVERLDKMISELSRLE